METERLLDDLAQVGERLGLEGDASSFFDDSLVRELDEPFSIEQLELALEPGPDGRETLSRWLERTASAPVP